MKPRIVAVCLLLISLAASIPTVHATATHSARQAPPGQTEPFQFVSQAAIFNPSKGEVRFIIRFNQPPDFFTADEYSRQAHSFQYFIVGDSSLPYPESYGVIIRGEEIHWSRNTLRIRNAWPETNDPQAGGWGSLRGVVPFRLHGNVLTFSVPLHLLTDHRFDGQLRYSLESYYFGARTADVESQTITPPRRLR